MITASSAARAGKLLTVAALLLGSALLYYLRDRPKDLEEGAKLFRSYCVVCHGLAGNSVAGVNLRHGKFRHAATDEDVVRIIREGVEGTEMPANNVTAAQAANIVAYLRTPGVPSSQAADGQLDRGRAIFEGKGACLTCHAAGTEGTPVGPYLYEIGGIRQLADLEEDLLEPNLQVQPEFRLFQGVTRDGARIEGKPVNEDTFSVQLRDAQGRLTSVVKSELRSYTFVNNSPMPSYREKLSREELSDLLVYLTTLTGL